MFLMWEKNRHQSFVFLVTVFSLQITTILSALNFPNFELKFIITFDIIAVDNFKTIFRISKLFSFKYLNIKAIREENTCFLCEKKLVIIAVYFCPLFFTSIYHYNIGLNFPKFQTLINHNFWSKSVWQVLTLYL